MTAPNPEAAPHPEAAEDEAAAPPLPEQERHYRPPARFGHAPVAREPLGWDPRRPGFRNHYPDVRLPTQIVERVSLGAPDEEANRLVWGDCLHAMRTLPSESVDLVYIDPPFFSNRVYNVIWGDEHEERSFSDIWEGGLDGYLIWLNARLYEMKRLLKPTGSIYVHCDWHASHYIKVEMDKIFGHENFQNEIIWNFGKFRASKKRWKRDFEIIFWYTMSQYRTFNHDAVLDPYADATDRRFDKVDDDGRRYKWLKGRKIYDQGGVTPSSVWRLSNLQDNALEKVGYPTQKPEALLERVIEASSNPGDMVLDAFVGGGTTAVVAQRLGRRWIAMDQSRVAVAVTAERLKHAALERGLEDAPVPDFTVEHWGVYESAKLAETPDGDFRGFVLACYDARIPSADAGIHGYKGASARTPVWVGPASGAPVSADDVNGFAQAIARLDRYSGEEGLRDGVMLAWGFGPGAREAARELREREAASIAFVRLEQVRIDSDEFRAHVASQSTERGDYTAFLTFVQPPLVEVAQRRLRPLHYEFDAGDTLLQNAGASVVNAQWDFDYDGRVFRAARGEWFRRKGKGGGAVLDAQHAFPRAGRYRVACRVQDDKGGEGERVIEVDAE